MPVYKCPNDKWKIGKDGKCRFKSKAAAERAFKHWIRTKAEAILRLVQRVLTENYSGWTNRATWNANLWLSNDYDTYYEIITFIVDDGGRLRPKALEDFAWNLWPSGMTPDGELLKEVNWREIAESWNENIDDEDEDDDDDEDDDGPYGGGHFTGGPAEPPLF